MPRQNLIQIRRGTKSQWISVNPVLESGEPGLETDTGRFKFGDGIKNWDSLDYVGTTENLIRVQNATGYAIQKGQAVYINGFDSYLNVPTVSPYISNGTISEQLFIGLISDYVSNGDYGFIVNFGSISGLNTTGSISNISNGNESWAIGDILYVHPTDYG